MITKKFLFLNTTVTLLKTVIGDSGTTQSITTVCNELNLKMIASNMRTQSASIDKVTLVYEVQCSLFPIILRIPHK